MAMVDSYLSQQLSPYLNHLSLKPQHNQIATFFAFQFYSYYQTPIVSGIQQVCYLLFTHTLYIDEYFLYDNVLAVLEDDCFYRNLVIIIEVLWLFSLFVFDNLDIGMIIVCLFPSFPLLDYCCLGCLFTLYCLFFFFQFSLKLFLAIMLVLQSEFALLVYPFKLILEQLQSIKESCLGMILIQDINKFFFVLLWDAFIEYDKSSSTFRVFDGINIKVESILSKLEMQVDFFIEKQRPDSDAEVFWFVLLMPKVISEFSDYLVVLFLSAVGYLVDQVQILFSLEVQLFILQNLRLHLWSLTKIREFLQVCLHKLNLPYFIISIFLILIRILL